MSADKWIVVKYGMLTDQWPTGYAFCLEDSCHNSHAARQLEVAPFYTTDTEAKRVTLALLALNPSGYYACRKVTRELAEKE